METGASNLFVLVTLWIVTMNCIPFMYSVKKIPNASLATIFLSCLSLNHLFGAMLYCFPWYSTNQYLFVRQGFLYSLYGVISFTAASMIFTFFLSERVNLLQKDRYILDQRLPMIYLVIGIVLYFVLKPVLTNISTFSQLVTSGWLLMITALCLYCWKAWVVNQEMTKLLFWLFVSLVLPFTGLINYGFLSFGAGALVIIFQFVLGFYKPKWQGLIAAILVIYLGLSVFVTYFKFRDELRNVVWEGGVRIQERIKPLVTMVQNFELLDILNEDQLRLIDGRLNQNILVGLSAAHLESGQENYANGETIIDAFLSVIPRAMWEDKPSLVGGNYLVSKYTGIDFNEDTSVGIGQVMELYVNFGVTGIVIGYFMLGLLVTWFDVMAGSKLKQGDLQGFVYWFFPCISMNFGSCFVELVSSLVFSVFSCFFINRFLLSGFSKKRVIS